MKKLLVVVDMQKDFIDGALGTEEAVKIVEPVAAKIEKAKAQGEDIIFTKDTHYKDYLMTQEGRKLPVPHCVKGTQGWELDERIRELAHGCRILEKLPLEAWNLPYWHSRKIMKRLSWPVCAQISV